MILKIFFPVPHLLRLCNWVIRRYAKFCVLVQHTSVHNYKTLLKHCMQARRGHGLGAPCTHGFIHGCINWFRSLSAGYFIGVGLSFVGSHGNNIFPNSSSKALNETVGLFVAINVCEFAFKAVWYYHIWTFKIPVGYYRSNRCKVPTNLQQKRLWMCDFQLFAKFIYNDVQLQILMGCSMYTYKIIYCAHGLD